MPHWTEVLKRRVEKTRGEELQSEEEKKAEETELFTKYYTEWKGGGDKDASYKNIPRFYYRLPAEDEILLQKLREESRAVFLQRKSRELLDNEELQIFFYCPSLCQTASQ
uniref:Protein phosphatase 2, regulatory subunit B'', gamma n=1 Tax=Neogobius melanostomus TaxID=47308 RepID=A0A8C6SMP8_9GOBI